MKWFDWKMIPIFLGVVVIYVRASYLNTYDYRFQIENGLIPANEIELHGKWRTWLINPDRPDGEEILYKGIIVAYCITVSTPAGSPKALLTSGVSYYPRYEGYATGWCERRQAKHPQESN